MKKLFMFAVLVVAFGFNAKADDKFCKITEGEVIKLKLKLADLLADEEDKFVKLGKTDDDSEPVASKKKFDFIKIAASGEQKKKIIILQKKATSIGEVKDKKFELEEQEDGKFKQLKGGVMVDVDCDEAAPSASKSKYIE